jgi:hypothetical protein
MVGILRRVPSSFNQLHFQLLPIPKFLRRFKVEISEQKLTYTPQL